MTSSPPPQRPTRIPGLDAARALAVTAMVVGHTADAVLHDAARALPWIQTYWTFRGLTAPLFLFVSGWAVMASVARSPATGWGLIRERIGRVGLLLLIGVLLRWPGWRTLFAAFFDREAARYVSGFDALQCIALSLLAGAIVLSVARGYWTRAAVVVGIAIAVPLASSAIVQWATRANLPLVLKSAIVTDEASPFPLMPWTAYFFAGASAGHLVTRIPRQWARAVALFATGAAAIYGAYLMGLSNLPQTSPVLFAWRLGQVLLIASSAMVLPVAAAVKLAPLGRSTLFVYAFHMPIVYGWSSVAGLSVRLGRALSPLQVIAVAAVLLVIGVKLAEAIRRRKPAIKAALRARWGALRERVPSTPAVSRHQATAPKASFAREAHIAPGRSRSASACAHAVRRPLGADSAASDGERREPRRGFTRTGQMNAVTASTVDPKA